MKTLGRHLLAELYGCDAARIDDLHTVETGLRRAAEIIGATVVGGGFHRYAPQGVSGVLMIAESHLSIHTWPEARYVAIDIFTCGGLDPRPGFEALAGDLRAESGRMQEIVRGLPDDLNESADLLPKDVKIITQITAIRTLPA